jgi:hypothetical protein
MKIRIFTIIIIIIIINKIKILEDIRSPPSSTATHMKNRLGSSLRQQEEPRLYHQLSSFRTTSPRQPGLAEETFGGT